MVITISRQFGSGGREIGKILSSELNIPFYDKEVIAEIAAESQLSVDCVEKYCEKDIIRSGPVIAGHSFSAFYQESVSDMVFKKQTQVIRTLAEKGDCIFVGRCADYICQGSLDVMVYADMESKIARCMEREPNSTKGSPEEMRKKIAAIDRQRARYYEYYTGRKWGDMRYYDLCVNTSLLGMDKAAQAVLAVAKKA